MKTQRVLDPTVTPRWLRRACWIAGLIILTTFAIIPFLKGDGFSGFLVATGVGVYIWLFWRLADFRMGPGGPPSHAEPIPVPVRDTTPPQN
jgi:hypothetical protein